MRREYRYLALRLPVVPLGSPPPGLRPSEAFCFPESQRLAEPSEFVDRKVTLARLLLEFLDPRAGLSSFIPLGR
jgi:hypothetical protein